jgi:multidrug resistance efflux pump
MADNINNASGGGNTGLAFIVGAVVVVLAVIAFFVFFRGGAAPETKDVNVDVDLPKVEAPAVPAPSGN